MLAPPTLSKPVSVFRDISWLGLPPLCATDKMGSVLAGRYKAVLSLER